MSYFARAPLVNYNGQLQVNLTRRVGIPESVKNNPEFYYEHNVQDGDTPENIADRFYDDANLAWVILQFNGIINLFEEWPKGPAEFDAFVNAKYDNPFAIHHYVALTSGAIVDPSMHPLYDRMPVTNYEYENDINEERRKIKLVLPELVHEIVAQHREMMERGV